MRVRFCFLHNRYTIALVFLPKIFELFFFKAVPTPDDRYDSSCNGSLDLILPVKPAVMLLLLF